MSGLIGVPSAYRRRRTAVQRPVALEAAGGPPGDRHSTSSSRRRCSPALMADESLDIIQRIAQKDADLVGEFLLQTEAGGQLPQAVAGRLPRGVAHSAQKIPVFSAAPAPPPNPAPGTGRAGRSPVRRQPLRMTSRQSTGGELPAGAQGTGARKGRCPLGAEAEQAGGLYPGQSGGAVLDQRLFQRSYVWLLSRLVIANLKPENDG